MSLWVRARKALRRQSTQWLKDHRTQEPIRLSRRLPASGAAGPGRKLQTTTKPISKPDGIPPLEKTALGVQLFREDREHKSWFTTISCWPDLEAMTAFTKGEPTKVHHLDRDPELLIELPESIQIHRIVIDRQGLR